MPNVNDSVNNFILNKRCESIQDSIAYTVTNTPYPFDDDGKRFMICKLNEVLDYIHNSMLGSLSLLGCTVKNIYFYQFSGVQTGLYRFVIDLSWNLRYSAKLIVIDALFVGVPYKECRSCYVTFAHSTGGFDIDWLCRLSVGAFKAVYADRKFDTGFAKLTKLDIDRISQKIKEFEELELVVTELIEFHKWCAELRAFSDKTKIPIVSTAGKNPYKQNINKEEKKNMFGADYSKYYPVGDDGGIMFNVLKLRRELDTMSDMADARRTHKKLDTVSLNDIVQIRVTGNGRGTTVYWADGTNTTVLKPNGVEYDGRTAIVFAMAKRNYNNESNAYTRAMDKIFKEKAVVVPTKKERKAVKKSKREDTDTETKFDADYSKAAMSNNTEDNLVVPKGNEDNA